jgi:hypothetical protein
VVKEMDYLKTPFPWFGGKTDAAPLAWRLMGDVAHYVEPFFGGGAMLLRRPHPANRAYFSETVNDKDGLLANFWRSIRLSPEETAEAASWPVSEVDKHARACAVLAEDRRLDIEHMMGDPDWHDPVLAGWWAWSVCIQIGAFGEGGPWWPDADGRLRKWEPGEPRPEPGVSRKRPFLGDGGQGVNRPQLREPGVSRKRPFLGDNGMGVNHPKLREPGVSRELDFHPFVMPRLTEWLCFLSARLRHVRILCGDWRRAVGSGASLTLSVRTGKGACGIFLDPPYEGADVATVYRGDGHDRTLTADVVDWALDAGADERRRIVIAEFDGGTAERLLEHGWTEHEWFANGHLKGGYGVQQHRERLYASPHCLDPNPEEEQDGLW